MIPTTGGTLAFLQPQTTPYTLPDRMIPEEEALDQTVALMVRMATGTRLERSGHMVQEHLLTGGKRLRARLALEAGFALGLDRRALVPWAASCELLHNATLVHDDIQDEDRVRRDQPTVWVRHGVPQAINAGDLLLMLPFSVLEHLRTSGEIRWQLSRAIARRAEAAVRGQSLEMDLVHPSQLSALNYRRAAMGKSGALLALPVEGAALLAGLDVPTAIALSEPFQQIGLLFQLQDDVLDLFGDKGRGERGCDIKEGKISALVVEHLHLHPEDRDWLLGILATSRENTSAEQVETVIQRFRENGALDAVLRQIDAIILTIRNHPLLRSVPELHQVALRMIALSLSPIQPLMPVLEAK